jgi:hypothetical protein
LPLAAGVSVLVNAAPAPALDHWQAIDQLRLRLSQAGVQVVQRDCGQRGLQGLYHQASDTIVICRAHREPAAVWNTLAHEATHRMQACRGGSITDPRHHRAMAAAVGQSDPKDLRSLNLYPAKQRLSELEARYTARLAPNQVIQLFERYCGRSLSTPTPHPFPRTAQR